MSRNHTQNGSSPFEELILNSRWKTYFIFYFRPGRFRALGQKYRAADFLFSYRCVRFFSCSLFCRKKANKTFVVRTVKCTICNQLGRTICHLSTNCFQIHKSRSRDSTLFHQFSYFTFSTITNCLIIMTVGFSSFEFAIFDF